jgi:GDPmannose 4,6-dehydratase
MLQQPKPKDFIICSGKSVLLKDIVHYVFDQLNIAHERIIIDQDLYRPTDIVDIYGDNRDAKEILKWD